MQDRVAALLRMGADAAASMNNELRVQLVKIPKQVSKAEMTGHLPCMHSWRFATSKCRLRSVVRPDTLHETAGISRKAFRGPKRSCS